MTVEAELAQLLIRMGTERGLDIETVLQEMAQAPLPSFVDADAVRGSMLQAVESWWRTDLEERLAQLRQQFRVGSVSASVAAQPTPAPPVVPVTRSSWPQPAANTPSANVIQPTPEPLPPISDATMHDVPENAAADPAEALPHDATMIWNTNHG